MEITDVQGTILRQPELTEAAGSSQATIVVRVMTDEGITGIGAVDSSPWVVKSILEAPALPSMYCGLRELLLGENPLEVERLWQKMYHSTFFYGRRGVTLHAIGGVDIALWDIWGKAVGKPICQLLGGARRDRVRAYASDIFPPTPKEVAEKAAQRVEEGFTAVKYGWGPFGHDPEGDVALVRAIREAVGSEADIMVDGFLGYAESTESRIAMVNRFAEHNLFWIEEPVFPDNLEDYAQLADAVETRVAAGENEATRLGFQELMDRGHVDVVQPDIPRCGGFTVAREVAAMAERRGTLCVPHSWSTEIIRAAALHLAATLNNGPLLEYSVPDNPLNHELLREPIRAENGYVRVPKGPGLGIELDEKAVAKYAVDRL